MAWEKGRGAREGAGLWQVRWAGPAAAPGAAGPRPDGRGLPSEEAAGALPAGLRSPAPAGVLGYEVRAGRPRVRFPARPPPRAGGSARTSEVSVSPAPGPAGGGCARAGSNSLTVVG